MSCLARCNDCGGRNVCFPDDLVPGPEGPAGPVGPQGPVGNGVPAGGNEGQIVAKASATDYDVEWIDYNPTPPGGTTGQILAKNSNTDFDAGWVDNHPIPSGGARDSVLTKNSGTSYDVSWKDKFSFRETIVYATPGTGSGWQTLGDVFSQNGNYSDVAPTSTMFASTNHITTSTAYASFGGNVPRRAEQVYRVAGLIRLAQTGDTDNFIFGLTSSDGGGFPNVLDSLSGYHCIVFKYAGSGNWVVVTNDSTTPDVYDTGVVATTNPVYLELQIDYSGNVFTAHINGSQVVNIVAGLPPASQTLYLGKGIKKSGVTQVSYDFSWIRMQERIP